MQPADRPPSRAPAEVPPPRAPVALPREPQDDIEFLDGDGEPPESIFMTQKSRQVRRVLGAGCWVGAEAVMTQLLRLVLAFWGAL